MRKNEKLDPAVSIEKYSTDPTAFQKLYIEKLRKALPELHKKYIAGVCNDSELSDVEQMKKSFKRNLEWYLNEYLDNEEKEFNLDEIPIGIIHKPIRRQSYVSNEHKKTRQKSEVKGVVSESEIPKIISQAAKIFKNEEDRILKSVFTRNLKNTKPELGKRIQFNLPLDQLQKIDFKHHLKVFQSKVRSCVLEIEKDLKDDMNDRNSYLVRYVEIRGSNESAINQVINNIKYRINETLLGKKPSEKSSQSEINKVLRVQTDESTDENEEIKFKELNTASQNITKQIEDIERSQENTELEELDKMVEDVKKDIRILKGDEENGVVDGDVEPNFEELDKMSEEIGKEMRRLEDVEMDDDDDDEEPNFEELDKISEEIGKEMRRLEDEGDVEIGDYGDKDPNFEDLNETAREVNEEAVDNFNKQKQSRKEQKRERLSEEIKKIESNERKAQKTAIRKELAEIDADESEERTILSETQTHESPDFSNFAYEREDENNLESEERTILSETQTHESPDFSNFAYEREDENNLESEISTDNFYTEDEIDRIKETTKVVVSATDLSDFVETEEGVVGEIKLTEMFPGKDGEIFIKNLFGESLDSVKNGESTLEQRQKIELVLSVYYKMLNDEQNSIPIVNLTQKIKDSSDITDIVRKEINDILNKIKVIAAGVDFSKQYQSQNDNKKTNKKKKVLSLEEFERKFKELIPANIHNLNYIDAETKQLYDFDFVPVYKELLEKELNKVER